MWPPEEGRGLKLSQRAFEFVKDDMKEKDVFLSLAPGSDRAVD